MRYESTDVESERGRGRVYDVTLYPSADELTEGRTTTIRTSSGDRLDLLANRFYGDASLWWVIAQANKLGGDTLNVEAGTQLEIPRDISNVLSKLSRENR